MQSFGCDFKQRHRFHTRSRLDKESGCNASAVSVLAIALAVVSDPALYLHHITSRHNA
jgi:hypothetical protein